MYKKETGGNNNKEHLFSPPLSFAPPQPVGGFFCFIVCWLFQEVSFKIRQGGELVREIERIRESVARGEIPPIYLWYGEDRFLIREALRVLKSYYFTTDPSGSGIELVSAKELSPVNIVERANTMSFFANRLVVVDDVTYFQDGQTADLEPFLDYFSNPNLSTCLLL